MTDDDQAGEGVGKVGRKPFVHSRYERRAEDHYPTIDGRCVRALLDTWEIGGRIVDNCAPTGSGIVDFLRAVDHDAHCGERFEADFDADWIVANPPYMRGVVDAVVEDAVARVVGGRIKGAAFLMRANWDLAGRRAHLFDPPWHAGQTRMRFRPWWSEDRKAQPIHSFVWLVWARTEGEPVVRYWPRAPK